MGPDPQLALLAPVAPPSPDWCRLIVGDTTEAIDAAREAGGADLVIADPPWQYDQRAGSESSAAVDEYACLDLGVILDHLSAARRVARPGCRLALWTTWAFLPAVAQSGGGGQIAGWRWVSGGVWAKGRPPDEDGQRQGQPGMGYHMRSSESEPLLVLAGPEGPFRRADVPGCWVQPLRPGSRHSEKPVSWQAYMVLGWCPPGGVVLDLYAGLGSVARAVARAGGGRRYIGAEIDPGRASEALTLLAQDGRP